MAEIVAAIEAAAPEAAGRITWDEAPLPFPAELEARALAERSARAAAVARRGGCRDGRPLQAARRLVTVSRRDGFRLGARLCRYPHARRSRMAVAYEVAQTGRLNDVAGATAAGRAA